MDDRYQNRLRFSFAHEIGHFILHKNIYENFNIKTFKDFYDFLTNNISQDQYSYFETQANKFANHLLVPREVLKEQREKEIEKQKDIPKNISNKTLNSYLAIPLSKKFGVSEKVIEIALGELEA
ncbi:ImmA/IrrE family metallo-endopeptidase [Patescibacteria group bacterium]|nr:ImmA/IrrE family metallo-endopeptidase [Patescibacteria group bacterium]